MSNLLGRVKKWKTLYLYWIDVITKAARPQNDLQELESDKIKEICPFYCSIEEHDYRQNFWYPWKPCSLPLSQIWNYSQSFRNALVGSPGDVLCQSSRLSTCSKMTWVGYLRVIGSKRSSRDWGTRSCSRPCHCWWGRQRHRSCAEQLASWVELDIFSRLTFFLENCAKGLIINKSQYYS